MHSSTLRPNGPSPEDGRASEPEAGDSSAALAAERDRLRAERDASNTRFHALVEGNADGIIVVDPGGTIRFANPRAAELFGVSREALIDRHFGYPLPGGGTTEVDLLSPGRPPTVVEMRIVPVEWEGGEAALASLRDITDRKRAEVSARELIRAEALRQAAEEASHRFRFLAEAARAADQAKTDLITVISHDLRTPLNSIIGYADLLDMRLHDDLGEESLDWVRRIRRSAQHQVHLIDQLLMFSRLDAGAEPHAATFDVAALFEDIATIVQPLADQRGLTLYVEAGGGAAATDPDMLRQIVLNLATNALKYTRDGGIRVIAERQGDTLAVRVEDTGIGIAPEHLGRIFEPFWQVEPGKRSPDGTGLGLSIVRRLARALGGQVAVESKPGDGSVFTLTIPVAFSAAAAARQGAD